MTSNRTTPLSGVSMTALGVALIRARESEREDALYDDFCAHAFAEAARDAFLDPGAPAGAARQWAQVEGLVDRFYEGRTVGVRAVDDRVQAWVDGGGRQLVMVGAGLDTRAFRMGLPADLRWFEIDVPEMFEFKEPVLAGVDARPTCARRVVAVDLRADWESALLAAGYDPEVPTAWVDEGAIPYLAHEDATEVAATITRLSAPGSEFGTVHVEVDETEQRYRDLTRLVTTEAEQRPVVRGLGSRARDWWDNHGWRTEFRGWNEITEPYGRRAESTGDGGNGVLHAVRHG
ncbi:SAM-dependent methyltransferase [Saccharopolyspora sp. NFXS83]|uniref:SAM-dependent methyltransferase n=1 Tax=Saccharopolyspora sp. NFXS83 TaxID=2993560 RepID=UPI00224B6D6F|nr:SAM-dependent methyltransferase [Saccharopolyspora sp. NFXS83]MCX2731062.1 SAM-dependent methyltransferase [Saccharopolyspora sp. NFXS83]